MGDDGFGCCLGNDEEPQHHTSDCSVHPWSGRPDPRCVDSPAMCPHVSPKQRLKRAVAAEMADTVHRSRKRSDMQRAIDAALAEQRAFIAGWLRGMARGVRGEPLPGVCRAEMAEQVAQWIEDEKWRTKEGAG